MLCDGWPVVIAVALSWLWTNCNHQGGGPRKQNCDGDTMRTVERGGLSVAMILYRTDSGDPADFRPQRFSRSSCDGAPSANSIHSSAFSRQFVGLRNTADHGGSCVVFRG
jgi:hypothetical protein